MSVRLDFKHSDDQYNKQTPTTTPPVTVHQLAEPTRFTKKDSPSTPMISPEKPDATPFPPKVNTEDGWRERERRKREKRSQPQDEQTSPASRPFKPTNYHFTSNIQENVSIDQVQEQLLDTKVTLPLHDILSALSELQKRFASLTKTCKEFGAKASIYDCDEVDEDNTSADMPQSGKEQTAQALLMFSTKDDLMHILEWYAGAVSLGAKWFFAMACGVVQAKFGTKDVTFLVDSGLELNLILRHIFDQSGVDIDEDGARWSLRGIYGDPVPLLGCCRDAHIEIHGKRFDHHFFVSRSETGNHDGILGQPWLQWFVARIDYERAGSMTLQAFPSGCKSDESVKIIVVGPDHQQNADRLVPDVLSEPSLTEGSTSAYIPRLGKTLHCLLGDVNYSDPLDALNAISLNPPETFDHMLHHVHHTLPSSSVPLPSPWTTRALNEHASRVYAVNRYKPVHRKKFNPVDIPPFVPLPTHPPPCSEFTPTERMTQERLDTIMAKIEPGFLSEQELDLIAFVLVRRQNAIAWTDEEREHTPWICPPFKIPEAIKTDVRDTVLKYRDLGKYEYSSASYRSQLMAVLKKSGAIRLVHNLEDLNAVTIRDSALPPNIDELVDSFVGRHIYMMADLFSGFNARILATESRNLTTFHSPAGPM
ncbi:hypothetical protein SCP_0312120 [Sparassis crispa]|uniref:DUF4100 domain-containing protein n=1 Tax=Sparassis crispa TaxID=139825 RepID=A0A401GHA8_9APHY|nr:hypothetical protein SCP_0312120 [Sparassis crispa]GBE81483.1 hypothetical protein SCP_0312120 [Sparassis crispa]